MKVWVVASSGLVGQDVVKELEKRQIRYVGTTHKEVDIVDESKMQNYYLAEAPTHIINCAADVDVDGAEGPCKERSYQVNVQGVIHLAHLAKKYKARLVHISTDYVFDGEKGTDYVENDPVHPINEYGKAKLEGEENLLRIYPHAVSIRTASLYGLGKEGLITGIVKVLQEKEEVRHISDQVSSPTYTKDLAGAIVDVLDLSGVYHYTNKGAISRVGLVQEVKRLCDAISIPLACRKIVGVTRKESQRPAMRPKRSVLNCDKIVPYLTRPIRSWQEALQEYFKEKYGAR